jgi:hypothetical protein
LLVAEAAREISSPTPKSGPHRRVETDSEDEAKSLREFKTSPLPAKMQKRFYSWGRDGMKK